MGVIMKKVADKEELLKVLDDNGKYTEKLEKRSIVHNDKLFHNEVALWIIDKENKKVLLQRRSPNKKQNPNTSHQGSEQLHASSFPSQNRLDSN